MTKFLGTLHADLSLFYCYWLHKFTIKIFLCELKYYLYIVDRDMERNNTHRKHCCVSIAKMVKKMRQIFTKKLHYLSFSRQSYVYHSH